MDAVLARWSQSMKTEALALEVGYRSRKDFYRVMRQTLQTTPALLRRLSPAERLTHRRRLHARLFERAV
jgi:AraC-like DNA-binding protein